MTKSWIDFLDKINSEINAIGSSLICFRGQSQNDFDLIPSLLRLKTANTLKTTEAILYYDFVNNAGVLLPHHYNEWDILFEMRHHGLPTRIMDWTENFAVALYFALKETPKSPTIWLLNPFDLNKFSHGKTIPNPLDLKFGYKDAFIHNKIMPYEDPVVIIAPRKSTRLLAQKGVFILQGSDTTPMNKNPKISSCFRKFELPTDAIKDAMQFLYMAGVNQYSLFPDLDGLAKHLLLSLS